MTEKTAITISRQTGSGGTYIGYLAAKKLGFRYLDREILQQAANEMGIEPQMLENFDGRSVPSVRKNYQFLLLRHSGGARRANIQKTDLQ